MAFEDVNILVRVGTTPTTVRWRQDGATGSLVTFSLSDNRDVRTYDWQLIGRPEGTGAAGGGPEPISLGTGQSCAITLDIQGTYIVACVINGGSPTQTIKTAGVAIICEITDPLGRPLRYLGGYETDEDLADPLVEQGWMKMLDRWLHALEHYIRGGGADTFKVALDTPDVLSATYGFLPDKLTSPNASIDITPRVEAPQPKVGLDVAKDERAPLGPVPGGDPGDGPKAAMWDHQHPPESASASTLYTGVIREATLLDPVVAFVKAADGSTGISSGAASLFDLMPDGTFRKKTNGQLYGLDQSGGETIVLEAGDRVAIFWEHPTTNHKYNWTCTVTTLGDSSTKAVLTKTADTLVHGSTFLVSGSGAQFEGWYWQLDTVDPIPDPPLDLVWIYVPSYVNTTTYPLLTDAQLGLTAPGTHETSVTIPGGSSGGVNFLLPIYTTLAGTPGVAKIPKGVVTWEVLAYLVTDNPAARTYIRAFLSRDQGILDRFAFGDSKPIHATQPTVFRFQATIPNDIDCDPTDLLSALFYGFSDSPTDITIKLVYNEPKHRTRVTVPLEFPQHGDDDHKFSIDAADEEADGADFAETKIVAGAGATVTKGTGSHGKTLQIGATGDHKVSTSDADEVAGKAGRLVNKARGDNITITAHVEADPTHGEQVVFSGVPASSDANGAWLYTARVPDSKLREPVRCLLAANFRPLLLQPVKCLVADQGTWTEAYNPVARQLVRTTVGEIFGLDSSHANTLALEVGDRVWFRGEYTQWAQEWSGIYTVVAKGSATEQAVLLAGLFDSFSVGKCFEVDGDGAYATGLWTCVQVSPALSFSSGEPLPTAVDGCGFGTWWQQISGTNLWQAPVAGPIYGQDQFADPSILLATDNRVQAYDSGHIVDEGQYYGPYEVLDPGYYYTPGGPVLTRAIIRRVLDADSAAELCNGMTVRVTPGDVAYSGNYFTISTADPIEVDTTVLAWSIAGSYTDGGKDRLLTTSQLGMASTTTAEVATEIPAEQFMEMLVALKPVTLDGTPGVSEFPAGPVAYEIACRVSSDDPAAEVLLSVALSPSPVGSVWIGEATSQPIRATSTTVYRLRAQVDTAVPLTLDDVLYWWFWASNSGSSPVTLTIVYNDIAHSTRVQTTLALAGGGTDDHRRLTATSKGWAVGQERWSALHEHPSGTVCSRFPTDCSAIIDGTGLLVIPDACSGVVLVTGSALRAIQVKDIDGNLEFGNQAPIKLRFVGACTLYHDDPLSGWDAGLVARVAKLDLLPPTGATGDDLSKLIRAKITMRFVLDTSGAAPLWILEVGE